MNEIKFLSHIKESDIEFHNLGGKAQALCKMKQAGINVPDGFVIFPNTDLNSISPLSIQRAIQNIGSYPVVVRSSANNEDGIDQSFAGLYESYVNVATEQELIEKIKLVRQSIQSERVKKYSSETDEFNMTVLVQKQVSAKYAGVLFSINPLSGIEEEILVECVEGLADKLVGGEVQAKNYILNSRAEVLSESKDYKFSLEQQQIQNLVLASKKISQFLGRPQDIEWCIDQNNKLWVVQSRPITKIYYRKDMGSWSNADFRDGGVSATACLPMMASLYDRVFQMSLEKYLRRVKLIGSDDPSPDLCGYFYGRLYWSTSEVKRCMQKIPGFNEKDFDADIGIYCAYGPQGPKQTPMKIKNILPFIPALLALEKNFKTSLLMAKKCRGDFSKQEEFFLKQTKVMNKFSDHDFKDLFKKIMDFHFNVESDYFTVIYNSTNYQSFLKEALKSLNKKLNSQIEFLDLISDIGDVAHTRINIDLNKLIDVKEKQGRTSDPFKDEFNKFVEKYYFFSDRTLDLKVPRWSEDPSLVYKHLQHRLPAVVSSGHFEKIILQIKSYRKSSFFKSIEINIFLKKLGIAREFLYYREEMRDMSTRLYFFVRCALLELGRRLEKNNDVDSAEDVLFVDLDSLYDFLNQKISSQKLKEKIVEWKERFEPFRSFSSPNEFGMIQDDHVQGIDGQILYGLGCSEGLFEGEIFVAHDLEQAQKINGKVILVTAFTEPGWTPLFPRLGGVITEVGGVLSHAAVISREYNLPAVLNVAGATQKLKSGDRVRIDGRRGTVEIISE